MEKLKPKFAEKILTERQVKRFSALANIEIGELKKKNIIELEKEFKWKIDPKLFLFRKVCGKVVKKDAVSGEELPVPFATVHIEDTDCKLLGVFPSESPWAWFLPISCKKEEIATVTTDECGRFCVWIPHFEIDWILRWRRERFCFPNLFIRPSIRDILEKLLPEPPKIKKPFPEPDPLPLRLKKDIMLLARAEDYIGRAAVEKLASLANTATIGESAKLLDEVMNELAFKEGMPPILPKELQNRVKEEVKKHAPKMEKSFGNPRLDSRLFMGPFIRCVDFLVPELMIIDDVPDITFKVTQDVDADGNEEVIYSESLCDVRWNEGPIPDVKLYASEIALTSVACGTPEVVGEEPGIEFAGLMPVGTPASDYHNNTTGYAIRPNRPHPSGLFNDPLPNPDAETPFHRTLQLYGSNQYSGADYYRIMYKHNGSSSAPFMHSWKNYRVVGGSLQKKNIAPDSNGWYSIIPAAENWHPHNLLMNWPTGSNGLYEVYMELGNASKSTIHTTSSVMFRVDNGRPSARFNKLEWREVGTSSWKELDIVCPVIERPIGKDIEIRISFEGWGEHFRSVVLYAAGCGAGSPTLSSSQDTNEHWYTNPSDNHFSNAVSPAVYSLPGTLPQGAYRFSSRADSRAFNPAGGDGGFEADWEYNPLDLYSWVHVHVSLVDK